MAITGILTTATSALTANARRINAVANNIANQQTEGFRPRDVRTVSSSADGSPPVFAGGGVQTVVIEEDGPVEPVEEFAKLIQARSAYNAALQTLQIGSDLARQTISFNA